MPTAGGAIDFGYRVNRLSGDTTRAERFGDLTGRGPIERFRFNREADRWFVRAGSDHPGRKDQRFWATYGTATLKVSVLWDQVPLNLSRDSRSLFASTVPGVLTMSSADRTAIQNGALKLSDVVGGAAALPLGSRRDEGVFKLVYSPTRALDLSAAFKTTRRSGSQPWGASFGFSNDVEVAAPIDTRSTDLNLGAEWANDRGMVRVGVDGSWFTNQVQTLVWDSPWRATDTPKTGLPAQGRSSLWPNTRTLGASLATSLKLPGDTRATGTVTVARWSQNQALIPFTINSVLPFVALDRPTADAQARTLAMNYTLTSRPVSSLWVSARYRYYDFDNRTPAFDATRGFILMDGSVRPDGQIARPLNTTRRNIDVDASFTPLTFTAFRVGYGREQADRTMRIFSRTVDEVGRASVDTTVRWVTVRGSLEHSKRRGSGFTPELLSSVGEQLTMAPWDVADRDRDRATALVQLNVSPALGLSASMATGRDRYINSGFGLRDNRNHNYSFTADVTPTEQLSASLFYTVDIYAAVQNQRSTSTTAQFNDATRNWSIDAYDWAKTAGGQVEILQLIPRTEARLAYTISRSRSTYQFDGVPGGTLPAMVQLPAVTNRIESATADIRHALTPRLTLGLLWMHQRYSVQDFAQDPGTLTRLDLPGALLLGYLNRAYAIDAVSIRTLFFW